MAKRRVAIRANGVALVADATVVTPWSEAISGSTNLGIDPTPQVAAARAALVNLVLDAPWSQVEAMLAACREVGK